MLSVVSKALCVLLALGLVYTAQECSYAQEKKPFYKKNYPIKQYDGVDARETLRESKDKLKKKREKPSKTVKSVTN